MLEQHFRYAAWLARVRAGPFGAYTDDIADELAAAGYARGSAKVYLSVIATLSALAARRGWMRAGTLDAGAVGRLIANWPGSPSRRSIARSAFGHLRRHLVRRAVWSSPPARCVRRRRDAALIDGYDAHLRDRRGLRPRSREGSVREARRFLEWYRRARARRSLRELSRADVLRFLQDATKRRGWGSQSESLTRDFLRYLSWDGVARSDLSSMVPTVPRWRLSTIPRHLGWRQVTELIRSVDARGGVGKRDRAVLLLLSRLGLRRSEVLELDLADIRWRTGEIRLRRTKGGRERVVPLPGDVGRALADYLLHGRPRGACTRVFLRHRAPWGLLRSGNAISAMVQRRLAEAGIESQSTGAHVLRHSLATRLVQRGAAIKEVADILGHRSIDTTAIYTKVDLPHLRGVALPFPGGGS